MNNNIIRKKLIFVILILFIGSSVLPNVSGNKIFEKNNQNVSNLQKIDKFDVCPISFHRIYLFGPIYNLTIDEDNSSIVFETHNMREFEIYYYNITTKCIHYNHFSGDNYNFGFIGFKFRGILKSTFICGYFYYFSWFTV